MDRPVLRARLEGRRISKVLIGCTALAGERVVLADLVGSFGNRAFAMLLLLFALPNAIPPLGIPGVASVSGILLIVVAAQMVLGARNPSLPGWLGRRSVRRAHLRGVIRRSLPALRRMEGLLAPRWGALYGLTGERLIGGYCLVLAVVLMLPVPFGNLLPAIAVSVIALGLLARDGLVTLLGMALGVAGMLVSLFLLLALGEGVQFVLRISPL